MTKRHVELGETVAPGSQLITGFSLSPLRVVTEIPQRYRNDVNDAEQFTVITQMGETLNPYDAKLFNYAHHQSRTFRLRLELLEQPEKLLPGEWVNIMFHYDDQPMLLVPQSSVIQRGELSMVYRVNGEQVTMNPIRVGQEHSDQLEVLSGLEAGDEIISDVVSYLTEK